ncbi:hypothetical protein H5410_033407 [Solanum commersonii]|uniref:Fe2OG dioxygenase domain-containing protein n=1 Tax=Solanum commersonii TaxID=4109 RepID=A0A9J5YQ24_SOLCO|nr:hypothetical protein H5410_033407 [Solanum commersonii]
MGSKNIKLPKIIFSHEDLKPDTLVWNQVKSQVYKALVEYGCFEASFDKIPIYLYKPNLKTFQPNPMWDNTILFHSMKAWALMILTFLIKLKNLLKFYGPKEIFLFVILRAISRVKPNNKEDDCGEFRGGKVHVNSTNYFLRLIKYKTPQSSETEMGLRAHTDTEILTILYQNHVNGLQLFTKDKQWKNINPTPGTFTIIIGDSLHAWTNGTIHAPYHRVLIRGSERRYSIGLFSTPKDGYTITTPKELINEDHPLLFKPYNHLEFLTFSYTEEGMQCESALKTYCGV